MADTGELITTTYVDNLIARLTPGLSKIAAGCYGGVFEGSD